MENYRSCKKTQREAGDKIQEQCFDLDALKNKIVKSRIKKTRNVNMNVAVVKMKKKSVSQPYF